MAVFVDKQYNKFSVEVKVLSWRKKNKGSEK